MSDAFHIFGTDLTLSATGDILLASGEAETNQRIIRRLFTNQGGYLWDLAYGAGLPAQVGLKANAAKIGAIIRAQIFQESTVAPTPAPTVSVSATPGGIVIATISYTFAPTMQTATLQIQIPPSGVLTDAYGNVIVSGSGTPIQRG